MRHFPTLPPVLTARLPGFFYNRVNLLLLGAKNLLPFNKNIPIASFLQAFIPLLPFKLVPPQRIHHSRALPIPLNLIRFSQKPDGSLSSERMYSSWEGRGVLCPESEILDECQQWPVWHMIWVNLYLLSDHRAQFMFSPEDVFAAQNQYSVRNRIVFPNAS